MKLHIFSASPNCRKVTALINYLEMDVEINELDLTKGEHKGPDILALNPNGSVPILEDGDISVWESNAILEYLADSHAEQHGENEIYPSDIKKRANISKWLYWQTAHFGNAISTIAWENFAKPIFGLGDPNAELVKDGLQRFHKYATLLEEQLQNNDYVAGAHLTIADFAMANTAAVNGPGKVPVSEYPAIVAWYDRLDQIKAWRDAAAPLPGVS